VRLGREIRDRLSSLRVALEYREYAMGHETSPRSIVDIARWLGEELGAPGRP
jgi:predicted esterase